MVSPETGYPVGGHQNAISAFQQQLWLKVDTMRAQTYKTHSCLVTY